MRCSFFLCWWVCNVNAIVQNEFRHIFVSLMGHYIGLNITHSMVRGFFLTQKSSRHNMIDDKWVFYAYIYVYLFHAFDITTTGSSKPQDMVAWTSPRYCESWLDLLSGKSQVNSIQWTTLQWCVSLTCDFSCICNPVSYFTLCFTITVFAAGWAPGCRSRSSAGWSPRAWLASPSAPGPRGRARPGGSTYLTWRVMQLYLNIDVKNTPRKINWLIDWFYYEWLCVNLIHFWAHLRDKFAFG